MVKISASLRNFRDRIRTSISIKTSNVLLFFALFLVVTLAIIIRLSPLIRGIYLIKAFDPWIQYYNAEYLSEHTAYEYINWVDFKSWFPEGFYRGGLRPGLTFTVVAIYQIFDFLGLPVSLYDICFFFPAFMGGLTVLVIYFLGKEILNRATGLFAAFFLAFNPGFLQRTTAGFFDNETIGVFATLMVFLFFLKAVKTGSFVHSILGGMFLGYLSLSWGGYQFVFLIIPIICIILILSDKYNENLLISYAGVQGVGLLIFSLFSTFAYSSLFSSLEIGGIFLFTIILIIFHIIHTKKKDHPNFYNNLINIIKWGFIPGVLIFAIIIWVAPGLLPFGFGSRFLTILSPLLRDEISLVASVAEQMPSAWSVFYFNTLIPLILVPLGIYFCFKRLFPADVLLIAFLILMYYFTGSMIRIILIFAPAAALMGAYGLASILKIFGSFVGERKIGVSRKRRRQLKGTIGNSEVFAVYLIVGFLCIAQVVHTSNIAWQQMSQAQMVPGGGVHDWEEALTWMKTNLKGTDVVVSWWDYGYWLTPIGNVTTVNDNATMNQTRIGMTGMALMQTSEAYSAKIFRRLKADYVLVYFGMLYPGLGGDEGKWNWMVKICNDNYETYKKLGMEEDNWKENSVFSEAEYQNSSTGALKDNWFNSQLAKLMFYGIGTNPDDYQSGDLRQYYANQILNVRRDDDGDSWGSHIPNNGLYDMKVFMPTYFSKFGLVKLYKIDYTILDSSFSIENAEVFNSGYGTFKIKNTGVKDLQFTNININDLDYDFIMGVENNELKKGEETSVWIDIESKGTTFQKDDTVKLNVTAQSEALAGENYIFSQVTSNFFVKEARQGAIKINYKNSKVIQINTSSIDINLEVENIGDNIVLLDRFYVNNDTVENRFNQSIIKYLSGSSILEPGEKANILIQNSSDNFYPIGTYNKIGVATPNNIYDEILFTSTVENFSLSILSYERVVSPEIGALSINNFRNHIPIDFNKTHAFTYDNGTTLIKIKVKNTGYTTFGLESIYLTESLIEVLPEDYYIQNGTLNLEQDEEELIIVDATDYISGLINEEILISVTGNFETTVASDIGYIYIINDEPDIQIIENVEGTNSSFIYANETGRLLIKNTGNERITLKNVYINDALASNVEYTYANPYLDIQDCAIISFDILNLKINKSNDVIVKVTTNSSAEVVKTFNGFVDSTYYDITIDAERTSAVDTGNLTIFIINEGLRNVTVDSVYINNNFISLDAFNELFFEIGVGNSLQLTIDMALIEAKIGAININDNLEIIVRTEEGAEIITQVKNVT